MGWHERWEGKECRTCGARRDLLVIVYSRPPNPQPTFAWAAETVLSPSAAWLRHRYATCFDRARCQARVDKRQDRARTRGGLLILAEPKVPDARKGTCRWCGETLTGENASRRNYCYPDREGRDCVKAYRDSRTWDARTAVWLTAGPEGLTCVDCGLVCQRQREGGGTEYAPWDADHDLALEDGGEHSLANLVCRCTPCHAAKTARENAARARRRGTPSAQTALAL